MPQFWKRNSITLNISTLKPRYSEQVSQTLFVHYSERFTISNVICLVNCQDGNWVLFTVSGNSLHQGSLYRGLSVLIKTLQLMPIVIVKNWGKLLFMCTFILVWPFLFHHRRNHRETVFLNHMCCLIIPSIITIIFSKSRKIIHFTTRCQNCNNKLKYIFKLAGHDCSFS